MCNCIAETEKKLTEMMKDRYPEWDVMETVEFENKCYILESGNYIVGNPVIGRVRKGKQIRKFNVQMFPTYCPFCGKKLKEDKNEAK